MKFSTSAVFASTVALAAAQGVFKLVPVSGGQPFHLADVSVYEGGLATLVEQNATCTVPGTNFASFTLNNETGALNLYADLPPAQVYVDVAEEKGRIQIFTGVQPPKDTKWSAGRFITKDGALFFTDSTEAGVRALGFQACPLHLGAGYAIWAKDGDFAGPSCVDVILKTSRQDTPIKCIYGDI
jgi:hypothetical protein